MLPPSFINFDASFATSVNEKHEINILLKKFSLDVFKYSPDNSDLSEKATAWTTKSICPQSDLISSKSFITSSLFSTSQLNVAFEFNFSAKGMRVNAISAGPIKTLAASAIGDAKFLYKWNEDHSFLKRNVDIHDVGNSALYLLSDLAAGVTGEIHYVDAGYNKVGMPDPKNIT